LAERFCRTADRINPARVPRSPHCFKRGSPPSDLASLCRLLQQDQNTSVTEQRCPSVSPGSAGRHGHVTPDPWWASSSLRSGLGFRYTQRDLATGADRSLVIGSSIHRLHSRLFKQPSALPQMERPIGTFDRDGDVRGTDSIYGSWPAGNGASGKRWNSETRQFSL